MARRFPLVSSLFVVALACSTPPAPEPAPQAAPSAPAGAAAPSEAKPSEAGRAEIAGIGHCCNDGACEGKEYHSAKAFAADCETMHADDAKWCAIDCKVTDTPYACECPTG